MELVVRKMLERGKMDRDVIEIVGIDSLVPADHLLRKIETAVDFSMLYEMVEPLNCEDNGRPSVDPKVQIPAASMHYAKELMEEVNADREAHGKKTLDSDDDQPSAAPKKRGDNTSKKKLARRKKEKKRTVTKSVTDPECGLFVKGEHKRQFAYKAHTACDKHGFILKAVVIPGNVRDSVAFDEVYDRITAAFPEAETIVADSAYKTPHICKKVFENGRALSTACKRPQTMKGGYEWWKYVHDLNRVQFATKQGSLRNLQFLEISRLPDAICYHNCTGIE